MSLVAPDGGRRMLYRQRHGRSAHVPHLAVGLEESLIASTKAGPKPGQVRALRQRLERDHIAEVGSGAFEHAARRFAGVDLRVALVAQDHEAMAIGELFQPREVGARGDRALRIGGRGQEERHGARQRRLVDRIKIGQEAVAQRGRQIDLLAAGRAGAGAIGGVERIRHQDRRPALARRDVTGRSDRGEEQPLAAAVQHHHLALRIDRARQLEPASQPGRDGAAKRLDALGHRVAAELGGVFRQHRPDEVRHRVLRLADGQRNQWLSRLVRRQQLGGPHEWGTLGLAGGCDIAGALRHAG